MDTRLTNVSATFANPKTEATYQDFIVDGDRQSNFRVLLFSLPIYALYILLDYFTLEFPYYAILIRLAATVICLGLALSMRFDMLKRHHEYITMAIAIILAQAVIYIIWKYTKLSDVYYVGLVQGCVFACFLLRMSFIKTVVTLMSFVCTFSLAVMQRPDTSEASLQIIVLTTMVAVCTIGSYLFQRFRRYDFQKVMIIEKQNAQLGKLLADAERGNERKIAALNMLVHFVKTPLHQIAGFSDILVQSSSQSEDSDAADNARYIKNATTDLTKSVNALLAYHRLDETESSSSPEEMSLSMLIEDFEEFLPHKPTIENICANNARIMVDPVAVRAALQGFADHYSDKHNKAETFSLCIEQSDDQYHFVLEDDARMLSDAQFADYVQPLIKLEGYLTRTGAQMPMGLRTVARAVDILGGSFTHTTLPDGNRYVVSLRSEGAHILAA